MNYIDDIKLTKNYKGQYVVESINFRIIFYKDFKKLYDDGTEELDLSKKR